MGLLVLAALSILVLTRWDPAPPDAPPTASVPAGDRDAAPAPEPIKAPPVQQPEAAAARTEALAPIDWVGDGQGTDGAEAEPVAEGRPGWKGQLVIGAAHTPLARAALGLTFAWLGTVLPEVEEDTTQVRKGERVQLDWRGETNALGHFALPFVTAQRDLFLLIDPDGPHNDVLMLRRATWPDETVDLGVIVLEERGGVRGQIEGQGRTQGSRVRAVDLPLTKAPIGEERRERALRGATSVRSGGLWATARGIASLPRWIQRRDAVLPFPETRVDRLGRFSLPSVRPGLVRLIVQTPGGIDLVRDVTVEPGRTTEVVLALPTSEMASVAIEDAAGTPVDVDVVVVPPGDGAPVQSVMPPRTTTRGLLQTDRHALEEGSLMVRRARGWPWETYRPERVDADASDAAARADYVVRLSPMGRLDIRVLDDRGVVVPDPTVTLLRAPVSHGVGSSRLTAAMQPVSTGAGQWSCESLPLGSYRLLARAPGHAPAFGTVAPGLPEHDPPVFVFNLLRAFAMTVRVIDSAGYPASGAQVHALPHGPDERNRTLGGTEWPQLCEHPVRLGSTNDTGELSARGFWDNSISLAAKHPDAGFGLVCIKWPRPDATVEIRLIEPGGIRGQLTERGGVPAETWLVRARATRQLREELGHPRMLTGMTVRLDDEGRFALDDLLPGAWDVSALRPHDPKRTTRLLGRVFVHPGAVEFIDIELDTGRTWGSLRGTTHVDGLVPLDAVAVVDYPAAARINAMEDFVKTRRDSAERRRRPFDEARARRLAERYMGKPVHEVARIDAQGRFEFSYLPAGRLRLTIQRQRNGKPVPLASRWIPARNARSRTMHIQVATGTLRVQVVAARGLLQNREVRVTRIDSDPELAYDVVSDASGEVLLLGMPAGEYELRPASGAGAARCTIVAGEDRAVQVMLQ